MGQELVGRSFQDFRSPERADRTIGDALKSLIERRWRSNAAKTIETRWGLDPKTARNVASAGHVSERTLTKAAMAERWSLWLELGEEMFGETYEQHLRGVLDELEQRRRRAESHRDNVRALEARASRLVSVLAGPEA